MSHRPTSQNGYTLVEVIVTMALIGIVLIIAAFSFKDVILHSRVNSTATELTGSLNFARSEAVTQSSPVSVCRSSNGTTCAGGGDYTQGWIVFADADADGVVDVGDTVMRVFLGIDGGVTLVGNANVAARVTFLASGFLNSAANTGTITASSPSGDRTVAIIIGPTGRVRVQ